MNPGPSHASRPLLAVQDVSISFGGLKAVQAFSLEMPGGALYGLIGPNGAGKTTVFNLLTGVYQPDCGRIVLDERRLNGLKPHQIAAAGLSRTFQNIRLFGELSVAQNVQLALALRGRAKLSALLLRSAGAIARERGARKLALELLSVFGLQERADEPARSLPYGHQRKLEILRALATQPKVLLLDEPAAGMNPQEKRELAATIQHIRERFRVAVLLIEHDMGLVMDICERITVLDHGETIAVGTPREVQQDAKVVTAYLGAPEPS
jgi:branched-chain amino acid transport system ATP-binding protein